MSDVKAGLILSLMLIIVVSASIVVTSIAHAKPQPNILSRIGGAADAGKAAGIAAFKAGLPDSCDTNFYGLIYCGQFHVGYSHAEEVAP